MRDEDFQNGKITSSVMERIRREERWAYPISGQWMLATKKLNAWFVVCFIAFLILIVFTFITLWHPSYLPLYQEVAPPPLLKEVVGSGDIGYAETGLAQAATLSLEQLVAHIGEPVLLKVKSGSLPESADLLLFLSMMCMIALILMMNWIAQHTKRTSH